MMAPRRRGLGLQDSILEGVMEMKGRLGNRELIMCVLM
jgi:hypothetical protein